MFISPIALLLNRSVTRPEQKRYADQQLSSRDARN